MRPECSLQVAAAHSDITTLGPLLQSSLLSALNSNQIDEGGNGSTEAPVCQSVAVQGCVHLVAMVTAPKSWPGTNFSDQGLQPKASSFAVRLLHTVLQDIRRSQLNSSTIGSTNGSRLAQVSKLSSPALDSAAAVSCSSGVELAVGDSPAVVSAS